jgi:hypothetical protein
MVDQGCRHLCHPPQCWNHRVSLGKRSSPRPLSLSSEPMLSETLTARCSSSTSSSRILGTGLPLPKQNGSLLSPSSTRSTRELSRRSSRTALGDSAAGTLAFPLFVVRSFSCRKSAATVRRRFEAESVGWVLLSLSGSSSHNSSRSSWLPACPFQSTVSCFAVLA